MKHLKLLALFLFFWFTTNALSQNALHFDGIDDFVEIPDHDSLDLLANDDMTIEFWFKTSSNSYWLPIIAKTDASNNQVGYAVSMYQGAIGVAKIGDGAEFNAAEIRTFDAFNDNIWHHFAAVLPGTDATNYLIYIDSKLQSNGIRFNDLAGEMVNSQPLTIGKAITQYGSLTIDELRIWNYTRTQTEIQTNMNDELSGTESGLVVNYNFNQGIANGSNPTVTHLINNGPIDHTGTLNNFALDGSSSNWVGGVSIYPVGILENNFGNEIKLYPNPTDGNFSIDLGESYNSIQATMRDLNGKLIDSKKYNYTQLLNYTIDEPAGVYILILESAKSKAIIKIVKE